MNALTHFFLRFTGRRYTPLQRAIAMVPGILIFLVLSPLVIVSVARYPARLVPMHLPRPFELAVMAGALLVAIPLMSWALVELWTRGEGSPAPIAPTTRLVTTGPYNWCRNPIELGTALYILAVGICCGSLATGLFSLVLGLALGIAYIKGIEEKEMLARFGQPYALYLQKVPFMIPSRSATMKDL